MISKLAEEIYEKSILLKKYSHAGLIFLKNRSALEKELYTLKEKTDKIISMLHGNSDYSVEYYELALFMNQSLEECLSFLKSKSKNYRNTVTKYIRGFHNLPRAFLPAENPSRITPKEAIKYFSPYIKLD